MLVFQICLTIFAVAAFAAAGYYIINTSADLILDILCMTALVADLCVVLYMIWFLSVAVA